MEDIEFSKIYEMEFVYVYKYILSICCNKELAEEITQQTFFRALEKYEDFRGECQIRTWLCQIAKNEYYKQNKKNKLSVDYSLCENMECDTVRIEDAFLEQEKVLYMLKILHSMKEPYKEVFYLRIFSELSYKEIGTIFGNSENWARVIFYRAKLKILNKLKEEDLYE